MQAFFYLVSSGWPRSQKRRQIEITAYPLIVTSMLSKTKHAQREFPPELVDRIIDFLHDEPRALTACSLVARSWTPASRYHRFDTIKLISNKDWTKFDRLIEISPSMVQYIRHATISVTGGQPASRISAYTSFTSLEDITISGVITPPWESEAAAISSVARNITSLTLGFDVSFTSEHGFWPVVRMFPNLVSFHPIEASYVTRLEPLQLSSLPCYSPPISYISVVNGQRRVLDDLCNPPYPLTSLSTLFIHHANVPNGSRIRALVETYAGQISQLVLHVRTYSHPCTSLLRLYPSPPC